MPPNRGHILFSPSSSSKWHPTSGCLCNCFLTKVPSVFLKISKSLSTESHLCLLSFRFLNCSQRSSATQFPELCTHFLLVRFFSCLRFSCHGSWLPASHTPTIIRMDLIEGTGESSSPPPFFAGGFSGYDVRNDVYNRLVESQHEEVVSNPDYRDLLDAHFNRLPPRYPICCFWIQFYFLFCL